MMIGRLSSLTMCSLALAVIAGFVERPARGADDPQIEVIIAEGVGMDVEGARKDAYRNAVRQAVGAYVDSETVVANDELITDRIVTLSPAFVEKAEQIPGSERQEDGLVRLRVRTHVRITKLLDALAAGKIKTRPVVKKVDTTSLLAELATKSDQHEARREILAKLLSDYPESCLTVEQSGKESIEKTPDGRIFLNVPVSITPNDQKYAAFSTSLCTALSATKRASGEFSVDGARFGPDPEFAKEHMEDYVAQAFTDDDYMLGIFPDSLREEIRRSCDGAGRSPIVGLGKPYLLWNGDDRGGLDSLRRGAWQSLRENSNHDWILLCVTDAKKDYQRTRWKWFHLTSDEYKQWFASTPATFELRTQLMDEKGEEVAGDAIELAKIGACRMYHNLFWCVPMYVNLDNADWYTPELRLVRKIEIDSDDAAAIAVIRIALERGSPPKR